MKMTYVIGHKKPDTDSVCASISYSYLKNKLGWTTEPRVLGNINKETKFALDYFKVEEPKYLNDVKVQIKNMSYLKDAYINEHTSIAKTFEELQRLGVTGLPLVDENNKLKGYINVKEMAKNIIQGDIYELNTSYQNILEVLNKLYRNSLLPDIIIILFFFFSVSSKQILFMMSMPFIFGKSKSNNKTSGFNRI